MSNTFLSKEKEISEEELKKIQEFAYSMVKKPGLFTIFLKARTTKEVRDYLTKRRLKVALLIKWSNT